MPDNIKGKQIAEFIGIKHFQLKRINISENKQSNSLYQKFKNEVKLPDEYIERIKRSKFVQHFYPA